MRWSFERDDAGLVWVTPDEKYPGFAQALADCLAPLSPRGDEPTRISTYWIDRTLTWLDAGHDTDAPTQLGSGNFTALERDGSVVRALALYDTFDPEELPVREVVQGLLAWRRTVLEHIEQHGDAVPTNDLGAVVGMSPPTERPS